MQFNSFEYLFFFLPLVVGLYSAFRTSVINKYIIFVASCLFYGWVHPWFLVPMFASAFMDYFIAQRIADSTDQRKRKLLLWTSIVFSLALMSFFKYTEWITQWLVGLAPILGFTIVSAPIHLILPPGVSFYTFETISYTVDVYRGEFKPRRKLLDYLSFIVFFPHLVAGPIRRAKELLPALASIRKPIRWEVASQALFYILWGIFLKTVFADNFGAIVENITGEIARNGKLDSGIGLIFAYSFAFQIYCDFSAYSLIARGSALLFGIDVQRNFLTPYFSSNPSEFWRRWNISLSTWLRDYLYIPLGGNERGLAITLRNLLIVMVLGGLWHGAGIFFILWGLWHGLLLILYRVCPLDDWLSQRLGIAGKALSIFLFFHLVCFGWILFRSSPHDFPVIMKSIAGVRLTYFLPWANNWMFGLSGPTSNFGWWLGGWWFFVFSTPIFLADLAGYLRRCEFPDLWHSIPLAGQVALLVGIFYGIVFMAARQASEFIYFAF
jgi:D-alanyl-lipoteichoic acid acyltransferase DltB (MBOAT superfamily)